MSIVVVTGAAGSVGRRVCRLLAADDTITQVIGIDIKGPKSNPDNPKSLQAKVVGHRGDLRRDDLKPLLEDADTIVHLASSFEPRNDGIDTDTAGTLLSYTVAF